MFQLTHAQRLLFRIGPLQTFLYWMVCRLIRGVIADVTAEPQGDGALRVVDKHYV